MIALDAARVFIPSVDAGIVANRARGRLPAVGMISVQALRQLAQCRLFLPQPCRDLQVFGGKVGECLREPGGQAGSVDWSAHLLSGEKGWGSKGPRRNKLCKLFLRGP